MLNGHAVEGGHGGGPARRSHPRRSRYSKELKCLEDQTKLIPIDIETELKKSFIAYSMAVIINRALPDVRDGLKPVHRRILYTMGELSMTPDKPYRKSVRLVGEVLGRYHPHGDTAVYDAMVRMAQPFSLREMLVDGQGNFGSVDGDSAAAMRYTEARLSKIAMEMIADIDKETVDYGPNFDNTTMQPLVLPARFPNLLVNGAGGIAVGMATNIPPHNLGETIDGVVRLIDNPETSALELMECIKGPDFPTGGTIMGLAGIRETYLTGRGRIVTRAKAEIESMPGNRSRIIVNEIPYQVNKARLVEKIAELVHEKKLEGISDLRDESDRDGMRIVIELKRDVSPMVMLNKLYKHTPMQDTFGVIMLTLVNGEPKVLSLKQILTHYLDHQKDVVTRRTRYDLNRAQERAHILEGLLIALDHIDAVIRRIRASRTTQEAREGLMSEFALSEKQAVAILEMRLQRLTGLEREKIMEEYDALKATIAYLMGILADEAKLLAVIRQEILQIKARFATPRRTAIEPVENEIDIIDLIQEEDAVVTLTHFGYVKRTPTAEYRAQRRGGRGVAGLSTREEDFVKDMFVTSTHTPIMFFTSRGRVFELTCYELPNSGRAARGTAIVNLLQLDGDEKISAVITMEEGRSEGYLCMATRFGLIKRTPVSEFKNLRKGGLIAISLREGDELMGVVKTDGESELLMGTQQGMAIRFDESDIRAMGRTAMGVRSVRLDEGDEAVGIDIIDGACSVLSVSENGFGKRTAIDEYRQQGRGGKGILAMKVTNKTGPLAGQLLVHEDEDVMLVSSGGVIIRMPVSGIPLLSRNTQGVILMRPGEGNQVVTVARLEKEPEIEGEEESEASGELGETADTILPAPVSEAVTDELARKVSDFADELLAEKDEDE